MKVFKFGGASISTVERIKNVGDILKRYKGEQLLIVVSAMGKTTNALEKVAEAFYAGKKEEALNLFDQIKQSHLAISKEFVQTIEKTNPHSSLTIHHSLQDFFTEVEWLLHDKPVRNFDYYYDQIVPIGEMLSSSILSNYLNSVAISNSWIDVRDVLRTDDNFRDAKIDWTVTAQKINEAVRPLFAKTNIVLTQGFIGATDENESTTLGREGSDYSAAVFAALLNAESQTIWKDVQGVMNADPKQYAEAQWIKELNYREVIEMAYYGAQVIHPKTIKPLQNKSIPLYVKSFIHPDEEGTCIHNRNVNHLPPIVVYKAGQVLVQLSSKDFSFVGEGLTAEVYRIFESLKFKPNLIQSTAISLLCVVDDRPEKVEAFALRASEDFDVSVTKDLTLLTVRHYQNEIVQKLTKDSRIVLQQQTPETLQLLMEAKA
ncbi:aspartate kinase [Flavisolibacter ginsenosidimutans]|uniref:Aspartokinase n=1 Tax=Flavisolibacter ginsenosidimutans TaxID=661481 RepID=A0A5B8UEZ4_9BACT|nr:aspartate kinase [Flavisolibacter ginsenosidimutans]QEC55002.1 aspartate kinase [Flavisolibacter ginsenosidimutans]